jgi:hypothetical protein
VLLLNRPHCRVHLHRLMKFLVIRLAHVRQEQRDPRARIAFLRLNGGAYLERASLLDRHQFLGALKLHQLLIISNAWKLQAIDFFVLAQL